MNFKYERKIWMLIFFILLIFEGSTSIQEARLNIWWPMVDAFGTLKSHRALTLTDQECHAILVQRPWYGQVNIYALLIFIIPPLWVFSGSYSLDKGQRRTKFCYIVLACCVLVYAFYDTQYKITALPFHLINATGFLSDTSCGMKSNSGLTNHMEIYISVCVGGLLGSIYVGFWTMLRGYIEKQKRIETS